MRLRRPLPAVQGDTLHIVGVGDNRIGKVETSANMKFSHQFLFNTLRIYSGDKKLYNAVLQYWYDLRNEKHIPDYLGSPNGKVQGSSLEPDPISLDTELA